MQGTTTGVKAPKPNRTGTATPDSISKSDWLVWLREAVLGSSSLFLLQEAVIDRGHSLFQAVYKTHEL